MPIHWTATYHCSSCGAVVTYEDESPGWQVDELREDELERARAYVAEHPSGELFSFGFNRPAYVRQLLGSHFVADVETRYFACPNCGSNIYADQSVATAKEPVTSD